MGTHAPVVIVNRCRTGPVETKFPQDDFTQDCDGSVVYLELTVDEVQNAGPLVVYISKKNLEAMELQRKSKRTQIM